MPRLLTIFISTFAIPAFAIEMCPKECPTGPIYNSQFGEIACVMKTSIIGPKDDRIPIVDAALPCPSNPDPHLACGVTMDQVADLLNAGARYQCPGSDGGTLNAWYLDDGKTDTSQIYTNAHAVIDDATNKKRSQWDKCTVGLYSSIDETVEIDPNKVRLGSFQPEVDGLRTDRARIGTKKPLAGKPLTIDPAAVGALAKGTKLYMIALKRHSTEVVIQACNVMDPPKAPKEGKPGYLSTDCDNNPGDSGGLMIAPKFDSRGNVTSFSPVAIQQGAMEDADYKPWSYKTQNSVSIILDSNFDNLVSE